LKKAIVKGVKRREPAIDFQTAHAAGLSGLSDTAVLRRAAGEGRILVSHDVTTMVYWFDQFIRSGQLSPGVFMVPQRSPISGVVDGLVLIWSASDVAEWQNRVVWLPL